MFDVPDPAWPIIALAVFFFGDALAALRPPQLIRDCLEGVGFPEDWWWALSWVKLLAGAGLVVGLYQPGVAVTVVAGAIGYFLAATYAHVRAGFTKNITFASCLFFLAASVAVLLGCFVF
ncbi:MAG: DoxX family protein [Gordonia sp. (in: high G+C Gram-positive bacteria)]|uniref:DoxX family protein n=1 Tax=Gordonia sp. (in: high G+C Gram-positive bacteria) TaxID=84139 RepID=UPI0039E62D6F